MANYQRYQILSAAEQNLFSPSCPVWVSRYQISYDMQTGKRLMQVRMVSQAEKIIQSVYLRILCQDAKGQDLTRLEMVPVVGLGAAPGTIFGEDQIITLWSDQVSRVRIYPQRVVYYDGTAWNEAGTEDYLAVPAPVPVRPSDPAYPRLAKAAKAGGAKNDFYFRSLRGVWSCTCGLPNSQTRLSCAYCGVSRAWLETNMDPERVKPEPPAPAPKPEPQPEPAPAPLPQPERKPAYTPTPVSPVTEFGLGQYLYTATEPVRRPDPAFEPARQEQPKPAQPEEPEQPKSNTGRIVAIVLAVLLLLGGGAFCAYRFLMPFLRYQEALTAQAEGDYDHAMELYEELGDYEDSAQRVRDAAAQKALEMMRNGDYQQAYEQLKRLEGYEEAAADCLYSMGVLAFNDKDVDTAWSYVEQLQKEYPDYEKTKDLLHSCAYSYGSQLLTDATVESDAFARVEQYTKAQQWFAQAEDYQDAQMLVTECSYRIACDLLEQEGNYTGAMEMFRDLGDYKDSATKYQDCMYQYCLDHLDTQDPTTMDYLTQLSAAGYTGAQALMDKLTGAAYSFHVSASSIDNGTNIADAADLNALYVHYALKTYNNEAAPRILISYTLPGGLTGTTPLNADGSASGARAWAAVVPQKCDQAGTVTLYFYDAQKGNSEILETITFTYHPPAPPETTAPDEVGP